jgi:predicted nucleotidyltransferase/HEPN domain-containing protein
MNTSLNQIPQSKQEELTKIAQLLSEFKEVEMVILFGSYARGNWVEDKYIEKGITYEYRSDYDILVVLKHEDLKRKFRIEGEVKIKLIETGEVTTPVSMIFHGVKHLNQALTIGNYFFKDIKKEGITLYDSEKFKLAEPKQLTVEEYQEKAEGYFDQWFENGNNALKKFQFSFQENILNEAAFDLHQAVERYYTTILLVFTDYRPKDHNLETLGIKAEMCDKQFAVFPQSTDEEKRLFELLKKAYIDARYKMDEYGITKEELLYLSAHVSHLKRRTAEICQKKIIQIGEAV